MSSPVSCSVITPHGYRLRKGGRRTYQTSQTSPLFAGGAIQMRGDYFDPPPVDKNIFSTVWNTCHFFFPLLCVCAEKEAGGLAAQLARLSLPGPVAAGYAFSNQTKIFLVPSLVLRRLARTRCCFPASEAATRRRCRDRRLRAALPRRFETQLRTIAANARSGAIMAASAPATIAAREEESHQLNDAAWSSGVAGLRDPATDTILA